MRFLGVIKLLGILLMLFSLTMIPPMIVAFSYHESNYLAFLIPLAVGLIVGFILWVPFCNRSVELKTRDGFLVVILFWTVLSLYGSLPFYIDLFGSSVYHYTDALFESTSGITTTGASIFLGLQSLPHALLYYRQQLQLFGGMGIIILAIAIMPMLGVGGMQLYRAEAVGPFKDQKLRPRLAETAKALWYIYAGLTALCILSYWAAGMDIFDAVGEGFTTVATGGFAMHNGSIGYYHSIGIDVVCMAFMLISAISYALHFQFIWNRHFSTYYRDAELRGYMKLLISAIVFVMVVLLVNHYYFVGQHALYLQSFFAVISSATTSGFSVGSFLSWPVFLQFIILFLAMIGGCGGSTAGGIKIVRCILLKEQGFRELKKLIHPNGVFAVKLGKQVVSDPILQSIWGFFAIYVALFVLLYLCLLMAGQDPKPAFGILASCLSNLGNSFGLSGGDTYLYLSTGAKWISIVAMIAGRLEIFSLLVIFLRSYWRR